MAIHEWPEDQRPRERLMAHGADALRDEELLAVLIRSGSKGQSAVDVGRDLLKRFGSLQGFLTASRKECLAQLAIGPVRLATVKAALELARRCHLGILQAGVSLGEPLAVREFLLSTLRDRRYEVFCVLHLDRVNRLIAFEELFRGTVDGASIYPREVVRQVTYFESKTVIFAHNHPSGIPEPSDADKLVTRRLKQILDIVGVPVLDHLVVGDGRCVSFAERGLL